MQQVYTMSCLCILHIFEVQRATFVRNSQVCLWSTPTFLHAWLISIASAGGHHHNICGWAWLLIYLNNCLEFGTCHGTVIRLWLLGWKVFVMILASIWMNDSLSFCLLFSFFLFILLSTLYCISVLFSGWISLVLHLNLPFVHVTGPNVC